MNTEALTFWSNRYANKETGWDIGYPSPQLLEYALQNIPKTASILIPGAGNAYEAEALWQEGYENITVLDIAREPLENLSKRIDPDSRIHLVQFDFFKWQGAFDFILEQTFFCAIPISRRKEYASKMHQLLKKNGRLAGLLFDKPFEKEGPPFGGTKEEYFTYFSAYFQILNMDPCTNSIPKRAGNELFFELKKI